MIDKGIQNGFLHRIRTLEDPKSSRKEILRKKYTLRNMNTTKRCYQHQPGQLYGTAKTHKFDNIADITVDNLKFLSIVWDIHTQCCTSNC